jgi:hypothetical protein
VRVLHAYLMLGALSSSGNSSEICRGGTVRRRRSRLSTQPFISCGRRKRGFVGSDYIEDLQGSHWFDLLLFAKCALDADTTPLARITRNKCRGSVPHLCQLPLWRPRFHRPDQILQLFLREPLLSGLYSIRVADCSPWPPDSP